MEDDELDGEVQPATVAPALPRPAGADEGDAAAYTCLGICTDEKTKDWWEHWKVVWMNNLREWEESDEERRLQTARNARKEAKEQGMTKAEMAALVEERVAALAMEPNGPVSLPLPEIDDDFPEDLAAFRERALEEANGRIELMRSKRHSTETRADETAVHRATLADAKAKVLGKETRYKRSLRLPIKDFRKLKSGTGARQGVSHLTGEIIEKLRMAESEASGLFELRDGGVDDEWAAQIGDSLPSGAEFLTALDLSHNRIAHKGAKWLASGAALCTNLKVLSLGSNAIDRRGVDAVADAVLAQGRIESLALNSLRFGELLTTAPSTTSMLRPPEPVPSPGHPLGPERSDATMGSLGSDVHKMLKKGAPPGKPVGRAAREVAEQAAAVIAGAEDAAAGLGSSAGKRGGAGKAEEEREVGLGRLLETLIATASLRQLDLGGNRMGPVLLGQLCDALSLNRTVRWVNVSGNRAGSDGGAHLGRLLATSDRLQFLDAGSNELGAEGAACMSAQLNTNSALTELRLSSNGMGAQDAPYLGQVLCCLHGLRALDVCGNDIAERSAAGMREGIAGARAAGGLTALASLKLSQNPVGDKGAMEVALALNGLVAPPPPSLLLPLPVSLLYAHSLPPSLGGARVPAPAQLRHDGRRRGDGWGARGDAPAPPHAAARDEPHHGRRGAAHAAVRPPPPPRLPCRFHHPPPDAASSREELRSMTTTTSRRRWIEQRASRCRLEELSLDGNLCSDAAVTALGRLVARGPWLRRLSLQGNFVSTGGLSLILALVEEHAQAPSLTFAPPQS